MSIDSTPDSRTANKTVVQRLYHLINNKEFDKFGTVLANAFVDRSNGSNGPEGMAAAAANLHRAYADLRIELLQIIAESDLVVVQWRETGRHVGNSSTSNRRTSRSRRKGSMSTA